MTNVFKNSAQKELPNHIAIIMDGNGRWALNKKLPRLEGHRNGVNAVRLVVEAAVKRNIPFLTLYAFSSENWQRPAQEVNFLMELLKQYIESDIKKLNESNIRIKVIGRSNRISPNIIQMIEKATQLTKNNTGLTLTFAFNYGAWEELVDVTNALLEEARKSGCDTLVTADDIRRHMFTVDLPDPDLLIRTSGEQRLSNFMLMQSAYAELVFQNVLWPDYSEVHFDAALEEYLNRDRRYGDVYQNPDEELIEEVAS